MCVMSYNHHYGYITTYISYSYFIYDLNQPKFVKCNVVDFEFGISASP
jgi:hypothetical protein